MDITITKYICMYVGSYCSLDLQITSESREVHQKVSQNNSELSCSFPIRIAINYLMTFSFGARYPVCTAPHVPVGFSFESTSI